MPTPEPTGRLPKFFALLMLSGGLASAGCSGGSEGSESVDGASGSPGGRQFVKLSTHDKAGYCDLTAGPDAALHALFTDRPDPYKPRYVYYRRSTDGGSTWTEPENLSDDESGDSASYGRLLLAGDGRLYAVWKYIESVEPLDGPGGYAAGRLAVRCLEHGKWSKRVSVDDPKTAVFSWFAVADPAGRVHVVWSRMADDAAAATGPHAWYANLVRRARLDGAALADVQDLVVPEPLVTAAERQRLVAEGRSPAYEQTVPRKEGLTNLRGDIDAEGAVRFVAERPESDGPDGTKLPRRIVYWEDGAFSTLYEFDLYKTYNTFDDPPALLLDGRGRRHLIRAPEKAEKACVRDYPLEAGGPGGTVGLGDPVDVVAAASGTGAITTWQAHRLADGRLAVTAALSEKGGYSTDDLELYLSLTDADGNWTAPVCLTDNAARKSGFSREIGGGDQVGTVSSYSPRFASAAGAAGGPAGVLMVNSEDTIVGLTDAGIDSSGRSVAASGGGRVDAPAVFFAPLK